jgi:hypothetical protein
MFTDQWETHNTDQKDLNSICLSVNSVHLVVFLFDSQLIQSILVVFLFVYQLIQSILH